MSLFLKIFLWFWLAMALVGLALVISTATMQSEPVIERWRTVTGDALAIYAQAAGETLEREGNVALAAQLERFESRTRMRAFVVDAEGREVAGRGAPPGAKEVAARARQSGKPEFEFSSAATLAAQIMSAPPGGGFVLVVEVPGGPFSALRAEPRTRALRLIMVLLTAGLVCYWLARYLSAPIVKLGAAARRIASGDLTARVGAQSSGGRRGRDELAELSRDFDLMAERIESLMTAQRSLISDISHELRSPLARLNVALGLARQRSGTETNVALDRIEREAERLNALIGQLLTLSRLESGAEKSEPRRVDLASLLREIVADADFEALHRGRVVRITQGEECAVEGSPELLRSAIENVVRNGVRYTAEETAVEISLGVEREGDNTHAIINVRDHGAGVPEAALTSLFRPFYRVADARDRQTGGHGLGLSITERAVRLHGGTVRASNAPGGGLIIEIRLPALTAFRDVQDRPR
ncbi:MAG: ATP-binding protein [Pyrinomonadaceae bacterium]